VVQVLTDGVAAEGEASIPLTRLTVGIPRRRLIPVILLLLAAATAGTALAPAYGWAVATRIVAAAAHGLFWSLLVPTVATLVPPARTGRRTVSVVLAGPAVAGVAGIPLGATLGAAIGWRVCFAALAVLLALAAAATAALRLPEPARPAGSATGSPAGRRPGSASPSPPGPRRCCSSAATSGRRPW
jgi:MFS transporter, DHA1 family, inner membrane transport protein